MYIGQIINNIVKIVKYLIFINNKIMIIKPNYIKPIVISCYKIIVTKSLKYHFIYSFESLIVMSIITNIVDYLINCKTKTYSSQIKINIKHKLIEYILKFTIKLFFMMIYSVVSYVVYIKNNVYNH